MNRAALIDIAADALRDGSGEANERIDAAMRLTGLRRAAWACRTTRARCAGVRQARGRVVRERREAKEATK